MNIARGSDNSHSAGRSDASKADKSVLAALPPSAFWAKRNARAWHSLEAHLIDVAAVTDALLAPGTALAARARYLADRAGGPPLPFKQLAIFSSMIHDVGKAHHGFQERRLGRGEVVRTSHVQRMIGDLAHVRRLGAASMPMLALRHALIEPLGTDNADASFELLSLVFAHHGRPWHAPRQPSPPAWTDDWLPSAGRTPMIEAMRLVQRAVHVSGLSTLERFPTAAESQLLAGVLTLADWLGSTEEIFPPTSEVLRDPDAYWESARERARHALSITGTARPFVASQVASTTWPSLFPHLAHSATPLQSRLVDGPLPTPGEIVVVESDTGSGKTEAALGLYARLRAAGRVDGMFFALPTRATASAMHERVMAFAAHWCPEAADNIVLASGGVVEAAHGMDPLLTDDDITESPALIHWASNSLSKAFAGELVVGTVDQALLASLPTRHAHLRLAALSRLLIVVDELHSYDEYMLALLGRLTEFVRASGGVLVAMSATLATHVTYGLAGVSSIPIKDIAAKRPFPSVTVGAVGTPLREYAVQSPPSRTRTYHFGQLLTADVVSRALGAARAGARVLVLRNTVALAVETIDALVAHDTALVWGPADAGPAPYHSRYTRADRRILDVGVRRDFSASSAVNARILVATQVAEQSLDVDFDLLITDLCPIDVLLQRLGRVHRHDRRRPAGFEQPTALVIQPDRPFVEVLGGRVPREWARAGLGSVYEDLATLALTHQLLSETPAMMVPRENRRVIEAVYHPESRDALATVDVRWQQHLDVRVGHTMGQRTFANRWRLPLLTESYAGGAMTELFRLSLDQEMHLRSRLGDDKVRIDLPAPVPNRFSRGERESYVDVEWRRLGLQPGAPLPAATATHTLPDYAFSAGRLSGTYTAYGWQYGER